MKKPSTKSISPRSSTTARNLAAKFDAGDDVLDYFDTGRVTLSHGGARPGAGRPRLGKARKMVNLSPTAIRRIETYQRRHALPHFSAAVEHLANHQR